MIALRKLSFFRSCFPLSWQWLQSPEKASLRHFAHPDPVQSNLLKTNACLHFHKLLFQASWACFSLEELKEDDCSNSSCSWLGSLSSSAHVVFLCSIRDCLFHGQGSNSDVCGALSTRYEIIHISNKLKDDYFLGGQTLHRYIFRELLNEVLYWPNWEGNKLFTIGDGKPWMWDCPPVGLQLGHGAWLQYQQYHLDWERLQI